MIRQQQFEIDFLSRDASVRSMVLARRATRDSREI
jgi:hypothetical protein